MEIILLPSCFSKITPSYLQKYLKEIVEATHHHMKENLALTQNTSVIQKRKNEQKKIAILRKKHAVAASARKTFAIMSGLDDTSVHLHK